MAESREQPEGVNIVAGILAAVLPGAGQIYRRQFLRGLLAGAGVLGLFFGGMLIGGIDVIDRREDRIWFLAQVLVGPIALGVDAMHQSRFKAYDLDRAVPDQIDAVTLARTPRRSVGPEERRVVHEVEVVDRQARSSSTRRLAFIEDAPGAGDPPNVKSLAKMNEIGTLYAAIAGMMNVIVFLDALLPSTRRRRPGDARADAARGIGRGPGEEPA